MLVQRGVRIHASIPICLVPKPILQDVLMMSKYSALLLVQKKWSLHALKAVLRNVIIRVSWILKWYRILYLLSCSLYWPLLPWCIWCLLSPLKSVLNKSAYKLLFYLKNAFMPSLELLKIHITLSRLININHAQRSISEIYQAIWST